MLQGMEGDGREALVVELVVEGGSSLGGRLASVLLGGSSVTLSGVRGVGGGALQGSYRQPSSRESTKQRKKRRTEADDLASETDLSRFEAAASVCFLRSLPASSAFFSPAAMSCSAWVRTLPTSDLAWATYPTGFSVSMDF